MGKCPGCGYDNTALQSCDACCGYEQSAIDAYLADVPLPEGWTEKRHGSGIYYSDEEGNERVVASREGAGVIPRPAHWPAIPQAVLLRAAVQCAKLREQ